MPFLNGTPGRLADYEGMVVIAVNVASKCGFRGFTILGFPSNQFLGQEPGTPAQIERFCSLNYGVTFPLYSKVDVKGAGQHPLFTILSSAMDDSGKAGDVKWNFEKFLVGKDGRAVRRFRSKVVPEDAAIVSAIEELLGA